MKGILFLFSLACVVLLSQAVPESAVLDKTYADIIELPSLRREEGHRRYSVDAFGKKIDLDLQRTEGLLPTNLPVHVYGEDEQGNPTVDDWTHRTDSFQSLYSDKRTGASLMVEDIEGGTRMSGLLGSGMIIEPIRDIELPSMVDNNFREQPEVSRIRHVVYKVKHTTPDRLETVDRARVRRAILPETLYVPVQVVVDYGLWKKMATTEDAVIKYIKQFYNSVNQIYSTLSWPKVAISIYGIQICKTAAACNMIESIKVNDHSVDATKTLAKIAAYAYDQKSVTGTEYALMMVMTAYDMCVPEADGSCDQGVVSGAVLGTACGRFRGGGTARIGIAEDQGVFHSTTAVAKNIARLLGMMRDGESWDPDSNPDMAGTPAAESCSSSDGYIMGQADPTRPNSNNFAWSRCSVAQLRWFSKQPQAACLHVVPTPGKHVITPSSNVGLDNQCKVLFGSTSKVQCRLPGVNSGNDELCQSLACAISPTECRSQGPAADGSYCGPQRHCQRGKCVCDPTAPKPTAPPRAPSCTGDHYWLLINGKNCVDLLSSADGKQHCNADPIKEHCCESITKYCKADPISCDGTQVVTQRPTPPDQVFTVAPLTTRIPFSAPSDIACGKSCVNSPSVTIDGKDCAALLSSSEDKRNLCDNPLVISHCCDTRRKVCNGYHSITPSCDDSCKDDPRTKINEKRCVELLQSSADQENYCEEDLVKQHCCATRWKVCPNYSPFGRK